MNLEILDDAEAVASAAADLLVTARGNVVLSGGSTPKRAYALAAQRREHWADTRLWLGDERHVPPDDERSNARMIREELLHRISRANLPRFEPVDTELDLEGAAADYEARLRDAGPLDLALMGLGPDAHTASLFEGKPAVRETSRRVVAVPEAGLEPFVARVTLTLAAFNAAREVVFLVAGSDKAEALARAFGDPADSSAPAALVRPSSGGLRVLADIAAARLI